MNQEEILTQIKEEFASKSTVHGDLHRHLQEIPDESLAFIAESYHLHPDNENIIQLVAQRIQDPQVFLSNMAIMDDESISLLQNMKEAPMLLRSVEEFQLLGGLLGLGYVFLCEEDTQAFAVLPSALTTLLPSLETEAFRQEHGYYTQIYHYATAAIHLYGAIPLDELASLIQNFQGIPLEKEELQRVLQVYMPQETVGVVWNDTFVELSFHTQDALHTVANLLQEQEGKGRYVPGKEEFLRYQRRDYVRRNPEYRRLEEFFLRYTDPDTASSLLYQLKFDLRFARDLDRCLITIDSFDLLPQDKKAADEMTDLILEADQHTRKWEHTGYTQAEILAANPLPLQARPQGSLAPASAEFSRNAACPCGSGKKYKRCCAS